MEEVYVIETTLGTGPRATPGVLRRIVERLLRAVIPAANPDMERSYCRVCKWWLEIDPAGQPQREIGFDEIGHIIVASPLGRNFGFFTDSNAVFVVEDYPAIEKSLFDAAWNSFEESWTKQHQDSK